MEKSIMWKYIAQEPEVLSNLLKNDQTEQFAAQCANTIKTIYFVAHGSSFNAAVSIAEFFAQKAGVRPYTYTPANFCAGVGAINFEDPNSTLVVVISQTGTSSGAIDALQCAKEMGFPTMSITAERFSPIAEKADYVLELLCGEEDSNAKTKGYSATLMVLMQLAIALGYANHTLSAYERQRCIDELSGMVEEIPSIFTAAIQFCEQHILGSSLHDLYVLGSGINVGTAQEGQLKLMETMCIPTMYNDIGEFSHGMHRAINSNSNILLIKGQDKFSEQIQHTYDYLRKITNHVWMIEVGGTSTECDHRLCLPTFVETQSILLTTLVIQVMSVYAPESIQLDPNRNAHNDFAIFMGTRVET